MFANPRVCNSASHSASCSQLPGSIPSVTSPTQPPLHGRVLRTLQEPPFSKILPREACFSAQSVALTALSSVLDPQVCTVNMDPVKHTLRAAGVLEATAQVAADQAFALVDSTPTMQTVQALWKLHR